MAEPETKPKSETKTSFHYAMPLHCSRKGGCVPADNSDSIQRPVMIVVWL